MNVRSTDKTCVCVCARMRVGKFPDVFLSGLLVKADERSANINSGNVWRSAC